MKKVWSVACAAAMAILAVSVHAQTEPPARPRRFGPCSGDLERLCSDVPSGKALMLECLSQHESELSDACRNHLKAMAERRRAPHGGIRGSCRADIARLCANDRGVAVRECLRQNLDQLAPNCRAAVERKSNTPPTH